MHGSPTNLALYQQVAHWQALQNYPKFALYGINQPMEYWAIQVAIDGGPTSWEKNGELLSHSPSKVDFSSAEFSPLLHGVSPEILERSIELWRENCHWLSQAPPLVEVLNTIHILAGTYFHSISVRGWLATAAWLASNDAEEKPSRRCPYCLELWDIVHDNPLERRKLLQDALARENSAHLRYQVMRYLPAWLPTSNDLRVWLESFVDEPDAIVRFWAAHHLTHLPLDESRSWIGEALCRGFIENIDREYNSSQRQSATYVVDALDRLGVKYLDWGMQYLWRRTTGEKIVLLPFAWHALLDRYLVAAPDTFRTNLSHWKSALSPEEQLLWVVTECYRAEVRAILQNAAEMLQCCNEEEHVYYRKIQALGESPWNFSAWRLIGMLESATLVDSFRSFVGLAGRLRQLAQALMALPLVERHLDAWCQMEDQLTEVASVEALLLSLAGVPNFRRQLALLTPILCADELLEHSPGESGHRDSASEQST